MALHCIEFPVVSLVLVCEGVLDRYYKYMYSIDVVINHILLLGLYVQNLKDSMHCGVTFKYAHCNCYSTLTFNIVVSHFM